MPGARQWAEPVALALVILAITYVSLVLGELVPKALALRDPERVACRVARPIQALVRAAAWPGRVLTRSTRAVLTLLGQRDAPAAPLVSEEEIRYLVREGATQGSSSTGRASWCTASSSSRTRPFAPSWCRAPRSWPWTSTPRPARCWPGRSPMAALASRRPGLGGRHGRRGRDQGSAPLRRRGEAARPRALLHPPLFVPESARDSEVLRSSSGSTGTWPWSSTSTAGPSAWSPSRIARRDRRRDPGGAGVGGLPYLPACLTAPISSTGPPRSTTSGSRRGCRWKSPPSTRRSPGSCSTRCTPCLSRASR